MRGRPPLPWCGALGETCASGMAVVGSRINDTRQAPSASQPTSSYQINPSPKVYARTAASSPLFLSIGIYLTSVLVNG